MGKPPAAAYKRSWKNLLLNARYQLRFTLFMVAVSAVFMAGLGYFVLRESKTATKTAIQDVQTQVELGFVEPQHADATIKKLEQRETLLPGALVGGGLLLALGLFAYGIKMTHKVAGPLFKIGLYLDKVKGGKYDKVWPLRKGDQLIAFYDHFRDAHEGLRKVQQLDVERLRAFVAAADKADLGSKSSEAKQRLDEVRAILKDKEASLG